MSDITTGLQTSRCSLEYGCYVAVGGGGGGGVAFQFFEPDGRSRMSNEDDSVHAKSLE